MRKIIAITALVIPTLSFASIFSLEAGKNLTIQQAGPRQGPNGLRFFNVEGIPYGNFASYGVAEMTLPGDPTITAVNRLSLVLVQSNAAFTTGSGFCNVYLTLDNATSFNQADPDKSPLLFLTANGPDGISTQLDTKILLGKICFSHTSPSDTVYYLNAAVPAAASTFVLNQFKNGGALRFIVTPGQDNVTGTFAGYDNSTRQGPTVEADLSTASSVTFSGKVNYDARSEPGNTSVSLLFRDAADINTIIYTAKNVALDANGNFVTTDLPPTAGTYNVAVKAKGYLSGTVGVKNTAASISGLNFNVKGGDIDGDNSVTILDYSVLSDYFDKASDATDWCKIDVTGNLFAPVDADIDADGAVTILDYSVLSDNFDQNGQ